MSLTDAQKRAVIQSWAAVKALGAEKVGVLLFKNIFEAAPGALQLFSFKDEPDLYESKALKSHGAAVVNTVGIAVAGLRDFESLVPLIQVLGRRHLGLGLAAEHFELVGAELIHTLEMGLGDQFTPEVREAWLNMYELVSSTMQAVMF